MNPETDKKIFWAIGCTYLMEGWIFILFFVPPLLEKIIVGSFAGIFVGWNVGNLFARKVFGKITIKDYQKLTGKMFSLQSRMIKEIENSYQHLRKTGNQLMAAQAKIDQLMEEFCPEKMTLEQIENWIVNWAIHQRPINIIIGKKIYHAVAENLSEEKYRELLQEAMKLVELDPTLDTPEGMRLDVLADIIEHYEKIHYPIGEPGEDYIEWLRRHTK